jgi:hypothetical protein
MKNKNIEEKDNIDTLITNTEKNDNNSLNSANR